MSGETFDQQASPRGAQVAPPEGGVRDCRTPEAKKWAEDFIPPQTCGAIDDAQNALELLRDANSQLRHAAHLWRRVAKDELSRRVELGRQIAFYRGRLAEIVRIVRLRPINPPPENLTAIAAAAQEGLTGGAIAKAEGR